MIRSFSHKGLKRFFETGDGSKLSVPNIRRIAAVLQALDEAERPSDLAIPGWWLHPLTGDWKGSWSLSASGNWRITFRFDGVDAVEVTLEDYH